MSPAPERHPTIWDVDRGYYTRDTAEIVLGDDDAIWGPASRVGVWRMAFSTYGVRYAMLLLFALAAAARGYFVVAIPLAAAAALVVAAEVHFVGRRRVIFTPTWVGVSRGPQIDIIDYAKVTGIGVGLGSPARNPWLVGRTATLVIERGDGIEPYLPRLFTWAPDDWESVCEFVAQQAREHHLPLR